ncbi:MAG: helix-turn-helix domain-containing protein [Halobacteriota archaeon]
MVSVVNPAACPIATSLAAGEQAENVTWAGDSDRTVEQFTTAADVDMSTVFETDEAQTYQFTREHGRTCPCVQIESIGYPLEDVQVASDPPRLLITVALQEPEQLTEVVSAAKSAGGSVSLQYLVRSQGPDDADPVVIDKGALTDRQRTVLREAYRQGYFRTPREQSAAAIAASLGIARSTFAEHLARAQDRLLAAVFAK